MEDEAVELYAYIKQIDNELESILKERELYRQKLIAMLPNIENIVPEMVLAPKEEEVKKEVR